MAKAVIDSTNRKCSHLNGVEDARTDSWTKGQAVFPWGEREADAESLKCLARRQILIATTNRKHFNGLGLGGFRRCTTGRMNGLTDGCMLDGFLCAGARCLWRPSLLKDEPAGCCHNSIP